MLTGRFGETTGRPYLEGRLYIPSQSINLNISFVVDTGADITLLMPSDGRRTTLDYSLLSGDKEIGGASGPMNIFTESAFLVFAEPKKRLVVYALDLGIAPDVPELESTNSLLGRDVLDHWEMLYRPASKTLIFNVISSHLEIPLSS